MVNDELAAKDRMAAGGSTESRPWLAFVTMAEQRPHPTSTPTAELRLRPARVTTTKQRPQPTSTPMAELRPRLAPMTTAEQRPQPASTPTAGLCTRGGAAPVAGLVTTAEQRPQLASTPTAVLHDERPPCPQLASMPKIQWADDLRRHPLCRTRETIEKKKKSR